MPNTDSHEELQRHKDNGKEPSGNSRKGNRTKEAKKSPTFDSNEEPNELQSCALPLS